MRRALESPIAIACFRDLTLCLPVFLCRISVLTERLAALPYFAMIAPPLSTTAAHAVPWFLGQKPFPPERVSIESFKLCIIAGASRVCSSFGCPLRRFLMP